MKINGYHSIPPVQHSGQKQNQGLKTSSNSKLQDQVEISTEAKTMQSTMSSMKFDQERAEKVQSLKQQINNGTYQIKPEDIAKKMLAYWNGK